MLTKRRPPSDLVKVGQRQSTSFGRRRSFARAVFRPLGRHRHAVAPLAGHPCVSRRARRARRGSRGGACAGGGSRSGSVSATRAAGSMPARHSASSTSRFPIPDTTSWFISRALIGALLVATRSRSCAAVRSSASGPRRSSSGSSSTPPRRRGSRIRSSPPPSKVNDDPIPVGVLPIAAVLEVLHAGHAVDEQATRHPEPQPDRRAVIVGVDEKELASAPYGGDRAPDDRLPEHRRGQALLQIPRVRAPAPSRPDDPTARSAARR